MKTKKFFLRHVHLMSNQTILPASASATIFNLKLRSYELWRVLGILTIEQEVEVEL